MAVQAAGPVAPSRWALFEEWVGTRASAVALFLLALTVFAVQSAIIPAEPGRDMGRYVQAYLQLFQADPLLPGVTSERGPLAAVGVGAPLHLGGVAAEVWLGVLYAMSIVAWGAVAYVFGPRAAILTSGLLLAYPAYAILFHGLSSDALFAAAFAGWAFAFTKAVIRPSAVAFLVAGLGMGALVLVRPGNQALIVCAFLPLFVRAPWDRRFRWAAAFFVGSAAVTQGWKAYAALRWGDTVGLRPSMAVLAAAALLSVFFLPSAWRRRLAMLAIPVVVLVVAVGAVRGSTPKSPVHYVRSALQSPSSNVFLFRVFEIDPIVTPGNGPASRELARVVERELLAHEPYRSYGIDVDEFFSSGSDRMFQDLSTLGGMANLSAVTDEAIREHPWAFASGIARTLWSLLWTARVYVSEPPREESAESGALEASTGPPRLESNEGEPIPAARFGRAINTQFGDAREVWTSATEHPLVFDDPRDERRWAEFEEDEARLSGRIPTHDALGDAVHRLNQASKAFPPLAFWLGLGLVALAVRRPRHALVALVPTTAGLVLILTTALVAFPVAHYAAPVAPAFLMLAAVGLVGAHSRRRLTGTHRRPGPGRGE